MADHRRAHRHGRVYSAAKVPEITAIFWVIKILTTGMGEAASDWMALTSLVLAGVVGAGGFALALAWQLRTTRYHVVAYWTAVAMVAVFGTMAADGWHRFFGLSYAVTTPLYAVALTVVLTWWYLSEGTLSIHSITTPRRELFYWATVLATFALGTAAGDLTAYTLNLGYFASGVLFGVLILVPLVAWRLGFNPIAAFWIAYILTRPLGASFADWLAKPARMTGLGYGDGVVTLVSLAAIVVLVAWVAVRGHGVQQPGGEPDADLELESV
jgi:uncharacterized membrane-anchored protein